MIKITRTSAIEEPIARLRVEGRIVDRDTAELANAAAIADAKHVLLDLSGVSFVDADGARAITALTAGQVTVIGSSSFVSATLRAHAAKDDEPVDSGSGALVARLRSGDSSAIEEVLRRYGPRLLATARRLLSDEEEARRAVQEGCLAALRNLDDLTANVQLSIWLRRFVIDAAVMDLRTRQRSAESSIESLLPRFDETGHWAETVVPFAAPGHEAPVAARHAVDRLPESFRTILVLCDLEDLGTSEVAALLGTTAAAVKRRLHQARQALRALLAAALADGSAAARTA